MNCSLQYNLPTAVKKAVLNVRGVLVQSGWQQEIIDICIYKKEAIKNTVNNSLGCLCCIANAKGHAEMLKQIKKELRWWFVGYHPDGLVFDNMLEQMEFWRMLLYHEERLKSPQCIE